MNIPTYGTYKVYKVFEKLNFNNRISKYNFFHQCLFKISRYNRGKYTP